MVRTVLRSRWFFPAVAALLVCASLIDAALIHRPPSALSTLLAVATCAVVGLCGRAPVLAPLMLAAAYVVLGLPGLTDAAPDVSVFPPAIAAYTVAARAERTIAVGTLVTITASLEWASLPSGSWVPELFVPLGPWLVGAIVRSRLRVVQQLEQRTNELEQEREAFTRLAAQRERARIAHELHDVVSHNMMVMIVQAGAGRVAPPEDPEQVAAIFRSIRAAGGAALTEMEQLVDVLGLHDRGSHTGARLADVASLVAQARSAGLDVTADLSMSEGSVAVEVEHAAYRAIQEGLTNVLKHAPGSHVQLRLQACAHEVEIEVRNTGAAGSSTGLAGTGSRLGLDAMNERIRARGGDLCAGPLPNGGWRFAVRLPTGTAP